MFIGGLSARAIRLKHNIEQKGIEIKETYPKTLAKQFKLKEYGYRLDKENIERCSEILDQTSLIEIDKKQIITWHHFDSLLALLSAVRYSLGLHFTHGDKEEGLIYT
jgi:predicted nuclease with RNAse H fold